MTRKTDLFDVAVVGGGPAGRIAALALAAEGFQTVLLAPKPSSHDGRTTALWQQSLELIEKIGVWPDLAADATPLEQMRMIDDTGRLIRAPEVTFNSSEIDEDNFGFNFLNEKLNAALEKRCASADNLTDIEAAVTEASFEPARATLHTSDGKTYAAQIVVAADGRNSILRETVGIEVKRWSYPQVAVVMNLEHTLPHRNISTEFHTKTGPFTLVPMPGNRSALVCVESPQGADDLTGLSRKDLNMEIERRSHSILGKTKVVTDPQAFPLSGLSARGLVSERLALVGEAAHVFPPIGAQGLNLSLRDVADLCKILVGARLRQQDIGNVTLLKQYEKKRLSDIRSRTGAVDALNRSLLSDFLPVQVARSAGLFMADRIAPLRRLLMREGMSPSSGFLSRL